MVGRLTELFPVELQEGRSMEDRSGRVDASQIRPITALEVTAVLAEDHAHRFIVRAAAEPHPRARRPRVEPAMRSASSSVSSTVLPAAASVIIEAELCEMEHPAPWKVSSATVPSST